MLNHSMVRRLVNTTTKFSTRDMLDSMKAYEVREVTTDFNGVVSCDRSKPEPAADEILIRVRACALNYRDLAIAHSELTYPRVSLPVIALSDGAGEVVEVGAEVERHDVGDRVITPFAPNWIEGSVSSEKLGASPGAKIDGTLAEYATYPAASVPTLPDHLSYEQGATLSCAGLTAWNALVEHGGLQAGERVLLLGTGGVSTFGLQFTVMHGADPYVISSSDEKLERARELGARHTLNYSETPDWGDVILRETGGVDHVIEVGGEGTLQRSIKATQPGGTVHLIGVLSEADNPFNPLAILGKGLQVKGVLGVGSTAMLNRMNRAIETSEMYPIIDRVFPFEEARAAYWYLFEGAHQGKVVITID